VGLLKEPNGVAAQVLMDNKVEIDQLLELIENLIAPATGAMVAEADGWTPKAQFVLDNSAFEAERFGSERIGTEHILIALVRSKDCAATRLINTIGANPQKIYADILIAMGEDLNDYKDEIQSYQNKDKSDSKTPMLDQYSRDLTRLASENKIDPVIGRNAEISRLVQILSRRGKNNPCLIGEPGVGKTAIVEGLAQRIVAGLVPDSVIDKRVVSLDLSGIVAGSKYRGEFEERIKGVISEVTGAGDILLFIDEIHTIIGAGGAEGAIDASNILKPSLARGEIQLIGATTIEEYRKYFEKDAALERRFQPVTVEEPSDEETVNILNGLRHCYEDHHKVTISDEAIKAAVALSKRYINDRFLPDKAIDLIDEASARLKLNGYKIPEGIGKLETEIKELETRLEDLIVDGNLEEATEVASEKELLTKKHERLVKKYHKDAEKKQLVVTENEIAEVVSSWTKIPVKKLGEGEAARLRKMESILTKRVVGQEDAVGAVARAVRRGRVGLKDPNRPIGSFLFLGPTGVGKTELTKALAEAMFGDEKAMIRVDMTEFMEKHSVSKLIGAPPGYVGYDDGGQLSEKVRRNPYSVILFDEIEKAHPDVFNVLLQILDDGHVSDAHGRKVDFKNTIIIMTSNAGAKSILEPKRLGFNAVDDEKKNYEEMKNSVMEEVKRLFKPEFINRIDEIMVFRMLNKSDMSRIVGILSKTLVDRCKDQMDIELNIKPAARNFIVEKSFDPKYGARPLKRKIQTDIEDPLAEEILSGAVKKGSKVDVVVRKDKLVFISQP